MNSSVGLDDPKSTGLKEERRAVMALTVEDDTLQICFELRRGLVVVVVVDCSYFVRTMRRDSLDLEDEMNRFLSLMKWARLWQRIGRFCLSRLHK